MSFPFFIARRYLKSSRDNRFFSWISTLTIVGITIGVCAMIVVLGVINGFEVELRERFLAANAHVLAYRFPNGMKDHSLWSKAITEDFGDRITGVSPFVYFETMGKKDYLIHSMIIKGISPDLRESVQSLKAMIRPKGALSLLQKEIEDIAAGSSLPDIPAIIIGARLQEKMNVQVGEVIELIAPRADENHASLKKELQSYKVVGIYDSGLQHYDKQLGLLSLPAAQRLFDMDQIVTGLEIGLKNPNGSQKIASEMIEKYQLSIKEWQSYNKNIFEAMRNERNVIGLIVALVAFVAGFNILTTLFVSVTQKRRDIAILKSLGAKNSQILKIFVYESFLIGLTGSFFGCLLGWLVSQIIEHIKFVDLPDIYLLARLPVSYDPYTYLLVTLTGLVIAVIAGVYPAWSASRTDPTKGIHLSQ